MSEKKEELEEMKKSLDKNSEIINRIRAVEVSMDGMLLDSLCARSCFRF